MRVLALTLIATSAAWSAAHPVTKPSSVVFEPNRGQDATGADFLSYGDGYALTLRSNQAEFISGSTRLKTVLAGARSVTHGEGESPLPGVVNYLKGKDQSRWIIGVPTYGRVRYRGIYPGVDLVYYGKAGKLEYDFVVAAGRDAGAIRLRYEGARRLTVDASGDLVVNTAGGDLRQHRPVVYQQIEGSRHEVAANYVVRGSTAGIALGAYDRRQELVIDPVLTWSTFVEYSGSTGAATGEGVAVDSSGNVYIAGSANSTAGDADVLISKLTSAGANVFTIHFGGSSNDYGHAIAVDNSGNIYVTGETSSSTFPADTSYGYGAIYNQEAFVSKIGSGGSTLLYSHFLGGSGGDAAYGLVLDSSFDAYVVGATASSDFPVSTGSAQTTLRGGVDAFVTKFDVNGTGLASTYLGGTGSDFGYAIAVDSAGDAFITGVTASTNFPVTSGVYQSTSGGGNDAFIAKLSPTLGMVFSTYLGGSGSDTGNAIVVDSAGAIYVTGETGSSNFPVLGAVQSKFGGGSGDVFLTKLNGNGQTLGYSTYLGGSAEDYAFGIILDSSNNAYITGGTASTDFPLLNAFQTSNAGSVANGILAAVDFTGGKLLFSSYLGGGGSAGTGGDYGNAVAVGCSSGLVVTGTTASTDFPTTSGTYLTSYPGGASTAFVSKIAAGPATPAIATGGIVGTFAQAAGPVAPGAAIQVFGSGFAIAEASATAVPLPTNINGTTASVNGIAAPLYYVSPTQVNIQVPYEVPVGAAVLTVTNGCGASQPQIIQVSQGAPYILQAASGDAIAFNQDGSTNSAGNPAAAGSVITVYLTGIGALDNKVATGAAAPSSPLSRASAANSATVGGWNAGVAFLGMVPTFVGLAQGNIVVPTLSTGTYPLVITVGGTASNGPNLYVK